jgi:hypothetical protein
LRKVCKGGYGEKNTHKKQHSGSPRKNPTVKFANVQIDLWYPNTQEACTYVSILTYVHASYSLKGESSQILVNLPLRHQRGIS